jgi:L-2-hydroxycarboxylate dehydrogenase (NAD+)
MEVNRDRAVEVATEAFRAHGVSDADARQTAEVLVSADAMDKHSHGLLRLPRLVQGIEHGNVDPRGAIDIVDENDGAAALDGGSRLGSVVASAATGEAMDRAEAHGVGAVGVRNSNHLGMLGYYTDQIRREGLVAIAMTNTEPAMPPYGGAEPVLGTNPIAVGLPTDPPFNLDMATSGIARGTVLHMKGTGEELPEGVALDADGEPTTDPEAALKGTILPFGGAKGSGLAIAVEVLAGGLVGAAMGEDVTGTYHTKNPCTKGDLFVALDPAVLGGDDFAETAGGFLRQLKDTETAAGFDEIRLPGERSIERDRRAETVDVKADLWGEVRDLAGER